MMQLIGYFLCVYLVFKGAELLQLGLIRADKKDSVPLVIGILGLLGAIVMAVVFAALFSIQASAVPRTAL